MHPDKADGSTETTERFQILQNAYEILINEEKRKSYDVRGIITIDQSKSYVVSDTQFQNCRKKYGGKTCLPFFHLQ